MESPSELLQMEPEFWYRYRDYATADLIDDYGDPVPGTGHTAVVLDRYRVLSITRKGAWLYTPAEMTANGPKKFVLRDARKRFACPTVEEAKESFIRRKRRQIIINRARIRQAEAAIDIVNGNTNFLTDRELHSFV